MGQGHDHGAGNANSAALTKALALTGAFLLAEVAGAYVYLASAESGYVTGETLNINGGMVSP